MKKKSKVTLKNNQKFWLWALGILAVLNCIFIVIHVQQRYQFFTQAENTTATGNLTVNHTNIDASVLTQAELDTARQQDILFNHQSVGGNILSGFDNLQNQDSTRYSIGRSSNPSATWYDSNSGIGDFTEGSNGDPNSKVDGFDSLIRGGYGSHLTIAFMKFCFVDFGSGQSAWDYYRPKMEALISDFPNVQFVWVTAPLETSSGNAERGVFNNNLRQYISSNGGVLYDLAAIESHDPSGNAVTDGSGNEALYDGYAADSGHLNSEGSLRAASALWYLFAKVKGSGSTSPGVSITVAPTGITPTLYCLGGEPCTSVTPTSPATTGTPTEAVSPTETISGEPTVTSTISQNPSPTPCPVDGTASVQHRGHKSRGDSGGGMSGFFQQLLEFLINLIKLLLGQTDGSLPDDPSNPC